MIFTIHIQTLNGFPNLIDKTKKEDFCCEPFFNQYEPDTLGEPGTSNIVPVGEKENPPFEFELQLHLNITKLSPVRIWLARWFHRISERFIPITVPLYYCNFCGEKVEIHQFDVVTKENE